MNEDFSNLFINSGIVPSSMGHSRAAGGDGSRGGIYYKNNRNVDTDEAMSQIVQLDKGLRSSSVSQQCESIMQFGDIIARYPVPAIVNASLLRLADLFRSTESNFVRYWITAAFDTVKGEFTKVLNREELINRIATVLSSNDPIARTLTLKTLTSMESILHDRIDLHHRYVHNSTLYIFNLFCYIFFVCVCVCVFLWPILTHCLLSKNVSY